MKKISSAGAFEGLNYNLSAEPVYNTQKCFEVMDNEDSHHSFGSSALGEMKKQVNKFFQECNSEISFKGKFGSDHEKS